MAITDRRATVVHHSGKVVGTGFAIRKLERNLLLKVNGLGDLDRLVNSSSSVLERKALEL